MDELSMLLIMMGIITIGCIITNYNKYLNKIAIHIDGWAIKWFDRRGLESHYQTWGHCGCCGKPIEGVFRREWAWGICDKCLKP